MQSATTKSILLAATALSAAVTATPALAEDSDIIVTAQRTEERLHDPEINLRIGFRFLKDLIARFDGDLRVALLAYNRGPTRVAELLAAGEDPANGYSKAVLSGVRKE
jgi:soluble lytic murein transglycosylase-like protein